MTACPSANLVELEGITPMQRPPDRVPFRLDDRCQRFVLEHPHGATLQEIGEYFGVTRERIRQIETKAFAKLAVFAGLWASEPELYQSAIPTALRQLEGEDTAA